LLVVGVGVFAAIVATRRRLLSAAVLLGVSLAYSIALKKVSIMLFPFAAYLFLDSILTNRTGKRLQLIGVGLVATLALVLTYAPWLIASPGDLNPANWKNGTSFFRYQDAFIKRDPALIDAAGGPILVYPYMVMDGFRQFVYKSNDAFRHIFNPGKPLLDPVFSVLFVLGVLLCICRFGRSQRERLAIIGLIVFMMPMVLSYPVDSTSTQGMARRLVGCAGFVAFISMIGMEWIFLKVRSPRWGNALVMGLAGGSVAWSVWLYVSVYRGQGFAGWLAWQGVEHSTPVRIVREVARRGERVILMDDPAVIQEYVITDLPHARIGRSGQEIAKYLQEFPSESVTVVIPATNEARQYHTKELQEFLRSVIPVDSWTPVEPQIFGKPSYYIARVGPRA
jgi:hypothetical protein